MRSFQSLVKRLTTPICQKNGFASASILLDWSKIVSPSFQEYCVAERVSFPPYKRALGTLYVRTPSHMAPEIAYLEPIILEKINGYYGYQAISRLVIRQGPLTKKKQKMSQPLEAISSQAQELIEKEVETVSDEDLKNALHRLGEGILRKEELKKS